MRKNWKKILVAVTGVVAVASLVSYINKKRKEYKSFLEDCELDDWGFDDYDDYDDYDEEGDEEELDSSISLETDLDFRTYIGVSIIGAMEYILSESDKYSGEDLDNMELPELAKIYILYYLLNEYNIDKMDDYSLSLEELIDIFNKACTEE